MSRRRTLTAPTFERRTEVRIEREGRDRILRAGMTVKLSTRRGLFHIHHFSADGSECTMYGGPTGREQFVTRPVGEVARHVRKHVRRGEED